MDIAIMFNDAGCILYRLGENEIAYDMFCGAMRALFLSCGGKRCDELDDFFRGFLLLDPCIQKAFERVDACTASAQLYDNESGYTLQKKEAWEHRKSKEGVFVWNEVFELKTLNPSLDRANQLSLSSSIILYHVALVLHEGHIVMKQRLQRSLTYYCMAWNSIVYFSRWCDVHDCRTALLCCGILNNTANVHHQIGNFTETKQCFLRMAGILQCLGPPRSCEEQKQREEFGLNYMVFCHSTLHASSA